MSSLQTLTSRLLHARFANISTNTNPQTIVATLGATAVLLPLLTYWTRCYYAWYALGGGGLPHNFGGWLVNLAMHLFARSDHRAGRAPYADRIGALTASEPASLYGPAGGKSFFSPSASSNGERGKEKEGEVQEQGKGKEENELRLPPPPRSGPRPLVPTTVAPQRQITQRAPPSTLEAQDAFLRALAAANPDRFSLRASALESPAYSALWLSTSTSTSGSATKLTPPPWFPARAPGEFAHVHPEGSTHVVLSLVDAARVVARGWGERHRLSGGGRLGRLLPAGLGGHRTMTTVLPWGYVLVYAPRDAEGEEMRVWRDCVVASARFVAEAAGAGTATGTGGREVEVVVPEV